MSKILRSGEHKAPHTPFAMCFDKMIRALPSNARGEAIFLRFDRHDTSVVKQFVSYLTRKIPNGVHVWAPPGHGRKAMSLRESRRKTSLPVGGSVSPPGMTGGHAKSQQQNTATDYSLYTVKIITQYFPSFVDALYFARSSAEILEDYFPNINQLGSDSLFSLFLAASQWDGLSFIAYAKYAVAWPMAKALKQLLPAVPLGFPNHPLLYSGAVRQMLKNRINSSLKGDNMILLSGLLQGWKRGANVVSPEFIESSMKKHRASLSYVPKLDINDMVAGGFFDKVDKLFNRFYSQKVTGRRFRVDETQLTEASTSASFQARRSDGGARSKVRSELFGGLPTQELLSMHEVRSGTTSEMRGAAHPGPKVVRAAAHDTIISKKNIQFTIGSFNVFKYEPAPVRVAAVVEPLKVRLITKGNTLPYYYSKFYQKALWGYLQKFPQFVLTGHELREEHLHDLLDREKALGLDFPLWVSGDYSAATDGLDINYTKLAFETSLRKSGLSEESRSVLRSVLYEQDISYPKQYNIPSVLQTNGQLMGSTLSFPILCKVNLACYWLSLEEYTGKTIDPQDLPVLINGDDILFRANDDLYQIWQNNIARVGFSLSLGKNYIHKEILTVNSQLYKWKNQRFTKVGYLNAGLLTGMSKSSGRLNAKLAPIWDIYNEIVRSCKDPVRATKRFLSYYEQSIRSFTQMNSLTTFNLFLPPDKGGLGFNAPPGFEFQITSFQRRFASFLEYKIDESRSQGKKFALPLGITSVELDMEEKEMRKAPTGTLRIQEHPSLEFAPVYGPYLQGQIPYVERLVYPPALAIPYNQDEVENVFQTEKRPKFPSTKLMREFRNGSWLRMSSKDIERPRLRLVRQTFSHIRPDIEETLGHMTY